MLSLRREGVRKTAQVARTTQLLSQRPTNRVAARIDQRYDAFSFDGGNIFYVSDEARAYESWLNPFAYDRYTPGESAEPLSDASTPHPLFLIGCGSYPLVHVLPALRGFERTRVRRPRRHSARGTARRVRERGERRRGEDRDSRSQSTPHRLSPP